MLNFGGVSLRGIWPSPVRNATWWHGRSGHNGQEWPLWSVDGIEQTAAWRAQSFVYPWPLCISSTIQLSLRTWVHQQHVIWKDQEKEKKLELHRVREDHSAEISKLNARSEDKLQDLRESHARWKTRYESNHEELMDPGYHPWRMFLFFAGPKNIDTFTQLGIVFSMVSLAILSQCSQKPVKASCLQKKQVVKFTSRSK